MWLNQPSESACIIYNAAEYSCSAKDSNHMAVPLEIHTLVSMPFGENAYVAWIPPRSDALVVDPGLQPESILDFLQKHELRLAAILNTHGHADHIGGNEALKAAHPSAPIIIGADEHHLLTDANANLSATFGLPITSPP